MLEYLHQSESDKTAGGTKTFQFSKYITFSIIMMLLKSRNQLLRFHRSSYDSSTRLFFFFPTCRHFRFAQNILCMTTYPTFWPRFVARAEKKEAVNSKRRLPIREDTLHRLVRKFESPLNLALKKLIKSNNTAHFKEQEMGFKFPCESHSDSHVLTSQPRVTQ